MNKVKIKLITIGHLPLNLNLSRVSAWKSKIFELSGEIENFALCCDSDSEDWIFSDELLKVQLPAHSGADFLIAIVNVPIEKNWYSRRLGGNQIVFTFYQIKDFLDWENIPIENAILRILFTYALLYRRSGNKIPSISEIPSFTHDETRGCLFDMNGIKSDIVQSCNKPIVCAACEERLKNEKISTQTIKTVQNEICKIRKSIYHQIFDFIKINPIISLVISSAFAICLGIIGSLIASFIYETI
jgi:hypothetical protein